MDRHPRPRQAIAVGGVQIQAPDHDEPGLPGAADPDKSFIPYRAFRYGLGYVKPRSISKLSCPLFSASKDDLLGLDLVVAATAE